MQRRWGWWWWREEGAWGGGCTPPLLPPSFIHFESAAIHSFKPRRHSHYIIRTIPAADISQVSVDGQQVCLCHFPLVEARGHRRLVSLRSPLHKHFLLLLQIVSAYQQENVTNLINAGHFDAWLKCSENKLTSNSLGGFEQRETLPPVLIGLKDCNQ